MSISLSRRSALALLTNTLLFSIALLALSSEVRAQVVGDCEVVYCFSTEGSATALPVLVKENYQYISTSPHLVDPANADPNGCIETEGPSGSGPLVSLSLTVGVNGETNVPIGYEMYVNCGNGEFAAIMIEDNSVPTACRYDVSIKFFD